MLFVVDLTIDDLRPTFQRSFSNHAFEQLFKKCDRDGDQRLNLMEFIQLVLPPQFTVREEAVKSILDHMKAKSTVRL
mgnify:FL=1